MNKYRIEIRTSNITPVIIEANSKSEAIEKVRGNTAEVVSIQEITVKEERILQLISAFVQTTEQIKAPCAYCPAGIDYCNDHSNVCCQEVIKGWIEGL